MSDIDVPAGQPGGPSPVPASAELPTKLRVHALAKRISVTSRRVLDTLAELGAPAKGAQSSIDRETALRVVDSLGVPLAADPDGAGSEESDTGRIVAEPAAADPPAPAATHREDTAPAAPLPLFSAPRPMFLPPDPVAARVAARTKPAPVGDQVAEDGDPDGGDVDDGDVDDRDQSDQDVAEDAADSRRRRRRGRRGRGRGRGADEDGPAGEGEETDGEHDTARDDTDEDDGALDDATSDADRNGDDADNQGEPGAGSRRRRRRRRRKDADGDAASDEDNDPPNTVTRVREPRTRSDGDADNSGIQGVRGSTRLEAKRQRRRDGRDAGRRRTPVLSEAEFLARRESVERTMVVRQHGERSEIGVLEDGVLVEHFVTSSGGSSLAGNVYLGRVQNVLPSMEAAFVDIGRGRNAVLYAGEVDWDAAGLAGKARRIEQALSSGDSILVQVTKDPVGHKGARLTTQISLPGRFLVYVPAGGTHGISRKLADTERKRLKDLLKEIVPDDAGVIIRTASEGVSQEALERDVRRLQAQWEVVSAKATAARSGRSKAPELLYEEPDLMIKVVRDQFNEDFSKLVVSGDDAWDTLQAYVSHVAPELRERLHRHVGTSDVFSEYRIDEQLTKALDRKVWLPSGGTLVIDRTEAMTVVDVNTGKFTGSGGNLEETVTRNNLEAAEEIVRQLRLRDIGGIIVIDFIDMVLESNRDLVLRRLTECLGRDRTRHQVAEVTSLGLVQMTRKRVGVGLLEAFSTPCEHCRGRGVLVSSDPVEVKADPGPAVGGGSARRRGRPDEGNGGRRRGGGSNGGGSNGGGSNSGGSNSGGTNGGGTNGRHESPAQSVPNGRPLTGEVPRPQPPTAAPAAPAAAPVTAPAAERVAEAVAEPLRVTGAVPPRPVTGAVPTASGSESADAAAPSAAVDDDVPVVPAAAGEPARPRRRRRAVSRPAGPPVGEDPV
ncbi:MAG: translation initiation factor IF-2 N-terminal domain-containing protein [Pseudonocardia sp.]